MPRQANLAELRQTILNPLARMLPLFRYQEQVYHMADRNPAGLEGYQPRWEVVPAVLGAKQTINMRIDLMGDFHLLAVLGSSSVNTGGILGFRVQLYDQLKKLRLQDRGIQFPNFGGASGSGFWLREPYHFDLPRSQALVIIQNLESAANTVQVVLYGVAAPFMGNLEK